ncbi:MAG: galactose oxidase-like domain-containing protein, partial [Nocardioides sp.]
AGQAYDEALWNTTASYNPTTKTWTDLGLPKFGPALVGFRGSAFSQMLPLRPNGAGRYDTVRTLSAGGVYGVSPGTYVGTDTSTLNTIRIGADGRESFASEATDALNNPRWYSTGVSLPTGEVIAFSGADRDEVVAPGSGTPVTTPEIFDPKTGTWTELANQGRGRTYHNSATLLTDGRVLVGGHSPILTGYAVSTDLLEKTLGFSNPNRDPSFEIFEPPNLFYGPRPVITKVDPSVRRGSTMVINTPDAEGASSVTLVRNTAMTHLVDSDQRTVELPIVGRAGDALTVDVTDNAAVLPDGPYIAFVNKSYAKGETPSVGRQVFVGQVPARFADDIAKNNTATLSQELAARGRGPAGQASAQSVAAPGSVATTATTTTATAARAEAAPAVSARGLQAQLPATGASTPIAVLAFSALAGSGLILWRRRLNG